ncbi:unnamed protein product [Leuciscus chuanchicus]
MNQPLPPAETHEVDSAQLLVNPAGVLFSSSYSDMNNSSGFTLESSELEGESLVAWGKLMEQRISSGVFPEGCPCSWSGSSLSQDCDASEGLWKSQQHEMSPSTMMNEAKLCWGNPIDAKLSKSQFRSLKKRESFCVALLGGSRGTSRPNRGEKNKRISLNPGNFVW